MRDGLHPVQQRLAHMHGSQCGFCTPGFVMSMYSLLRSSEEPPSEEDIEDALGGNLWWVVPWSARGDQAGCLQCPCGPGQRGRVGALRSGANLWRGRRWEAACGSGITGGNLGQLIPLAAACDEWYTWSGATCNSSSGQPWVQPGGNVWRPRSVRRNK